MIRADNLLLALALILLAGLLASKLVKRFKIPNVTGYLLVGLLIGPAIPQLFGFEDAGLLSKEVITSLKIITDIELGFIAFIIGSEFKVSFFKRVGITPIVIAFLESLFAVIFIAGALILFGFDVPFALSLGAIGAATAPAATIMVIKQYRAKGEVSETLMSVVAIDDASTLIYFGFAITIAQALLGISGDQQMFIKILMPFLEVIISLVLGALFGVVLSFLTNWFSNTGNRSSIALCVVLLVSGLAIVINQFFSINVSALLACMAMGAVFTNLSNQAETIMELVDRMMPPIIIMFFVLSGADMNLAIIPTIGIVGFIYIVFRMGGKLFGTWLGGTICKSSKNIKKYLGLGLIPQGGVAIGLSLIAVQMLPSEQGMQIRAVVLVASLICDFVGPLLAKYALSKSKEITTK